MNEKSNKSIHLDLCSRHPSELDEVHCSSGTLPQKQLKAIWICWTRKKQQRIHTWGPAPKTCRAGPSPLLMRSLAKQNHLDGTGQKKSNKPIHLDLRGRHASEQRCFHVDFTSISLRFQVDVTSSHRFHLNLMSISLHFHLDCPL